MAIDLPSNHQLAIIVLIISFEVRKKARLFH